MWPSPMKPVLSCSCWSVLGTEITAGSGAGWFVYFGAELCALGLELSSGYDISFRNGIKSLKTGFKYSNPGVKDANVIYIQND